MWCSSYLATQSKFQSGSEVVFKWTGAEGEIPLRNFTCWQFCMRWIRVTLSSEPGPLQMLNTSKDPGDTFYLCLQTHPPFLVRLGTQMYCWCIQAWEKQAIAGKHSKRFYPERGEKTPLLKHSDCFLCSPKCFSTTKQQINWDISFALCKHPSATSTRN